MAVLPKNKWLKADKAFHTSAKHHFAVPGVPLAGGKSIKKKDSGGSLAYEMLTSQK